MSHLKERKEKTCLNCGTALTGRYCHVCGQENLEPKETVWHLVQHFFNDITHFDGKFFSTVKYLLRKPGWLSAEYMAGRRASYLNPIRMYVFTSAIFFLILFSLKRPSDLVNINETQDKEVKKSLPELEKMKLDTDLKIKGADDDDRQDMMDRSLKLGVELAMIKKTYGDTTTRTFSKADRNLLYIQAVSDTVSNAGVLLGFRDSIARVRRLEKEEGSTSIFNSEQYNSVEAYDSAEKILPDSLKDGWVKRTLTRKIVAANEDYRRDKRHYFEHFAENMLHSFPKIMFFSLPFFAFILNMLYFRHKQYYYVDHGIFSIHVYCATFLLTLAMVLVQKIDSFLGWRWLTIFGNILIFLIFLYGMIYLYKAMRGFYGQGRGKTFIKYLITCLVAFIINTILLVVFVLISAISI